MRSNANISPSAIPEEEDYGGEGHDGTFSPGIKGSSPGLRSANRSLGESPGLKSKRTLQSNAISESAYENE